MLAQRQVGGQWTLDGYLEMERSSPIRHEFVGGSVYAMAGGSRRHNRICRNVTQILDDHLGDGPCQIYTADMKVRLANGRDHVYPDASVSCDPRDVLDDAPDYIGHPKLIVEVLSGSTEGYDRGAKFDLYRESPALEEYVLVETARRSVELRARGADGAWVATLYGPDSTLTLRSVGLTVPLGALYRGVGL